MASAHLSECSKRGKFCKNGSDQTKGAISGDGTLIALAPADGPIMMSSDSSDVKSKGEHAVTLRWTLLIDAIVIVLAAIFGAITLARKWPFTREAMTKTLQGRFAGTVAIRNFRRTYFPPGCVAEEVSFEHRVGHDGPSLITIRKLIVTGSYSGLLGFHKSVPQIQVIGLHVRVPPKRKDGKSHNIMPLMDNKLQSLGIGEMKTNNAILEFRSNDRAREPFRLLIHELILYHLGSSGPISFHASLRNTEPPGEIRSEGQFGLWNADDPGSTPVSGSFTFANANLGVFKGISGTLSSTGKFRGTLDQIECNGRADVPNFQVHGSKHVVHLATEFQAEADAGNGDTKLHNVRSNMQQTTVLSEGGVSGRPGQKGKTVALDMTVKEGRIDDFLRLFTGQKNPSMTGPITLHATVEVPSDSRRFLQKLSLQGDFGIGGARLTNARVQAPLNQLSESAQGESKKEQAEDFRTVLSNMKGHVVVKDGIATLSRISCSMPGAFAEMRGTFDLLNKVVDIKGVLHTTGKLSDTTSGFKAVVLKAAGPLLRKKSITVVPLTIKGTSAEPVFGLDFAGKRSL